MSLRKGLCYFISPGGKTHGGSLFFGEYETFWERADEGIGPYEKFLILNSKSPISSGRWGFSARERSARPPPGGGCHEVTGGVSFGICAAGQSYGTPSVTALGR